jgi:hypothetical protein
MIGFENEASVLHASKLRFYWKRDDLQRLNIYANYTADGKSTKYRIFALKKIITMSLLLLRIILLFF